MFLTGIKLTNFKNYHEASIGFKHRVNIIFGNNGSGKTNFLDAIHFLSVSKSYFGLSDKYLIREGEEFYRLEGKYDVHNQEEHLVIKYKRERKREIVLNSKKLARVNELIGRFPIVLIAPDDIKIVKGNSKDRRDYFNKWLCQSNTKYLDALMQYNRLLRQKDASLKAELSPSPLMVQALNHKMVPLAIFLHDALADAFVNFKTSVSRQYTAISNNQESLTIVYHSDLNDKDVHDLFENNITAEIASRRPLVGIQRDEYEFLINDKSLKKFGSQGQIKSALYALRLAEFEYLRTASGRMPVLILDDFFEKLDTSRLSSLLNLINSGAFGQVFLSDTELDRSRKIFEDRGIIFGAYHVEQGRITSWQ